MESRARADFALEQLPVRNYVMDLGPEPPRSRAPASPVKAPQDQPEPPPPVAKSPKVDSTILCTGTITAADGSLVSSDWAKVIATFEFDWAGGVKAGGSASAYFNPGKPASFYLSIPSRAASVMVAAGHEGFATAFAGPFTPPLAEKLSGLQMRLSSGFSAAIEVSDETGQPIPGAKLRGKYPGLPEVEFSTPTPMPPAGSLSITSEPRRWTCR